MRLSLANTIPLALALALIIPFIGPSQAAWTEAQGGGLFIGTATLKDLSWRYDSGGRRFRDRDSTVLEASPYIAYGVTPWLTAIAQPRLALGFGADGQRLGLAPTDLGARVRLWSGERSVLSVQGSFALPTTSPRFGGTRLGWDARVLFGHDFGAAFVVGELGWRHVGERVDEWRADATLGLRPAEGWLLLAQSFNLTRISAAGWQSKLQVSVVRDVAPGIALQAGGFTTIGGSNYGAETGGILAIWLRF